MSKEFSMQTALILNANGIKTYLFENLRPVPELSFAVRNLGCTAGVMITASHNPPKYNGYKVYWDDGSQIVAPRDKDIIAKVRAVESYSEIKEITREEAEEKGLFNIVGTEMDDKYLSVLKSKVLNPEIVKEEGKTLKVVYTPLTWNRKYYCRKIIKRNRIRKCICSTRTKRPRRKLPNSRLSKPRR